MASRGAFGSRGAGTEEPMASELAVGCTQLKVLGSAGARTQPGHAEL